MLDNDWAFCFENLDITTVDNLTTASDTDPQDSPDCDASPPTAIADLTSSTSRAFAVSAVPVPVANCDFYWAKPKTELTIPGFMGILTNDSDPSNLPLTAEVTKINFGVSTHPYSVDSKTGALDITPGNQSSKPLVITYDDEDTADNFSAPTTVTIEVSASQPPLSAAGNCGAPQYGVASFASVNGSGPTLNLDPAAGTVGNIASVCGTSKFNWYTDVAVDSSRVVDRGPSHCIFVFSNQVSSELVSASVNSNESVSQIIVDLLSAVMNGFNDPNLVQNKANTSPPVVAEIAEYSLEDLVTKASLKALASAPEIVETVVDMFDPILAIYDAYQLAKLGESISKFLSYEASGFSVALTVEAGGCLQFEFGPNGKRLSGFLTSDVITKSQAGIDDPAEASAHVQNSKGKLFSSSLVCSASADKQPGFAKVNSTGTSNKVFSKLALTAGG